MSIAHVLAVDDDPSVRQMIADYLGDNDIRVTEVIRTERGAGYVFCAEVEVVR